MSKEIDYGKLLKDAGLKDTDARRSVLQSLTEAHTPLLPLKVYERVQKLGHNMSPVTVYRILEALKVNGVAHFIGATGEFVRCNFDHKNKHHVLLKCESCGEISEQDGSELSKAEHALTRRSGFHLSAHVHELLGTCKKCISPSLLERCSQLLRSS